MCSYIPRLKQVYLNSDRTMCIKIKIDVKTGSDKNAFSHVAFLESFVWGEFITLPKLLSIMYNSFSE